MGADEDLADDIDHQDDAPRVRPWTILLGSLLGLAGTVGAVVSWFVVHPSHTRPDPQGSAAAVGRSVQSAVAWSTFVVCAVVAVVATVTLVIALREARAARRTAGSRPPLGPR